MAKLLGQLLSELGIRQPNIFVETTGEKLVRMGAAKAAKLIQSAMNGVLFIDEAYTLNLNANAEGRAVAGQLLEVAENDRTKFTIIMSGYKDDVEEKLFHFNNGFQSRFPFIFTFEDYNPEELGMIFRHICHEYKWDVENDGIVRCAARRLSKGRGRKTFANARSVRILFESAYRRALQRRNHEMMITLPDILGPRPDPLSIPYLRQALDELNRVIGLSSVKEDICDLIKLSIQNYDLELRGEEPKPITLNCVFFGNPGTGKTTIAKLYGRIIKGLGLLSDGQWELKQPKDFIGSHVGESQTKTGNLIERCAGKILIIDEAYGFYGSSFGADALNTLD